MVDARLKRTNPAGDPVDWTLVDDAENTDTGLSDPILDYGVRNRLQQLIDFRSAANRVDELRYAEKLTENSTIDILPGTIAIIHHIGWMPVDEPNAVKLRWADGKNIWYAAATQKTILEIGEDGQDIEIVLDNNNPVTVNIHYELMEL